MGRWHDARWLFSSGGDVEGARVAAERKNDVFLAPIAETNVIAVTTVWYNTVSKEIVEADIQMNTQNAVGHRC